MHYRPPNTHHQPGMAAIWTALMGALGHSEQEKMFRPWWDALEDFVIYALIMLGLIVSPTTIFNGTPLFCTLCTKVGKAIITLNAINHSPHLIILLGEIT